MGFLHEVPPGGPDPPLPTPNQDIGFGSRLFRAQARLPRVIDAESEMAAAVLLRESELTRIQKESILLVVADARRNACCVEAHYRMLRTLGVAEERLERMLANPSDAGLRREDALLLSFCLKLARQPTRVDHEDCQALRKAGLVDEEILEAILVTGLTDFLCTLSAGLGLESESPSRTVFSSADLSPDTRGAETLQGRVAGADSPAPARPGVDSHRFPHLRTVDLSPDLFPPFAFFKERFGFIPNLFRAQTLRPDVVAAEARIVDTVLLRDDVLPRRLKEYMLLAISAAHQNTYCVAVHSEMLLALGVPEEISDQIAVDYRQARLSESDRALLDFAVKLATRPGEYGPPDPELLRRYGFTEEQILEAIVVTSLTRFLNTLQAGLGTVPDFEPRIDFARMNSASPVNLSPPGGSPMDRGSDPDGDLVARARQGDLEAFAMLVERHHRGVYRVAMGIAGLPQDAEDVTQSAFLRAFEKLDSFQGGSAFGTWLTRIAINEALTRLRSRRGLESLEPTPESAENEESWRPRELKAWTEDPETLYTRTQSREILQRELLKLPPRYRAAVMLRDLEQLSTEEAAAMLGLPVPTLKTHLLRGRLMLREALAPYFIPGGSGRGTPEGRHG